MKLDEWYTSAYRGTSGDMVYDILADWKAQLAHSQKEHDEYCAKEGQLHQELIATLEGFHEAAIEKLVQDNVRELERVRKEGTDGYLTCPFCGEHGFDKPGLKCHLPRWCEEYPKVEEFEVLSDGI